MDSSPDQAKAFLRAHFDSMAPIYDGYGRLFYDMAEQLLSKNPIAISQSSIVHDNASGNGVCSSIIIKQAAPNETPSMYATDFSPNMIEELKKKPHLKTVKAEVMESEALTFPDETFTHSVTNMLHVLALYPEKVTEEIFRTLRPGGVALASQFVTFGWPEIAQKAMEKIRPNEAPFRGPVPEEWTTVEWFKGLFMKAGFEPQNVQVYKTTIHARFEDMAPEARAHQCKTISMMVAGSWGDAERNALYEDLIRRMDPKTAEVQGMDHETLLLVAKK